MTVGYEFNAFMINAWIKVIKSSQRSTQSNSYSWSMLKRIFSRSTLWPRVKIGVQDILECHPLHSHSYSYTACIIMTRVNWRQEVCNLHTQILMYLCSYSNTAISYSSLRSSLFLHQLTTESRNQITLYVTHDDWLLCNSWLRSYITTSHTYMMHHRCIM